MRFTILLLGAALAALAAAAPIRARSPDSLLVRMLTANSHAQRRYRSRVDVKGWTTL